VLSVSGAILAHIGGGVKSTALKMVSRSRIHQALPLRTPIRSGTMAA
jgi:hypothetical protein